MRIALDHQTFTQQTYGGISKYFSRLIEGLSQLGEEARVFAPLHINSYLEDLPSSSISGKRVERYPYRSARFFIAYNQIVAQRKIAHWQPDIVHETYYAKRKSGPAGCPTVVTVYDMIHELFPAEFSRRVDTSGHKRVAVQRADHVICISENTRSDLVKLLNIPQKKISVVHLGCDQEPLAGEIDASPVFGEKPFLLYVGVRSGYKNFSNFLRAVSSSSKLMRMFNVAAFGGGGFSPSESALVDALAFAPGQVRQVSGPDVLLGRYYRQASALVYPSMYEGFGIPPLEAMARDCPVICSNTSSMPEVVGTAGAFFSPGSIEGIRSAIESVVLSDTHSESLKALGRERIRHYSWSRCAEETRAVYRALL